MDIRDITADFAKWEWTWGHAGQTAIDLVALVPMVGCIKYSDEAIVLVKATNKASNVSQAAIKYIDDVASLAKKLSPYDLTPTHSLTLSSNQYAKLKESIRLNGITETIKYVEYDGVKYIVDGHHRVRIAKELNILEVPVEKVKFPYKGYSTTKDLLWWGD